MVWVIRRTWVWLYGLALTPVMLLPSRFGFRYSGLGPLNVHGDKVLHGVAYLVLVALIVIGYHEMSRAIRFWARGPRAGYGRSTSNWLSRPASCTKATASSMRPTPRRSVWVSVPMLSAIRRPARRRKGSGAAR